MKEEYISFEVAKLLKEKGFNVSTEMVWYEHIPSQNVAHKREIGSKKLDYFYWDENTERNSFYTNDTNENGMPVYITGKVYSAPTHQLAMKWLREVHKVNIEIHYNRFGENYKYLIIYKPEVLDDIRSLGVFYSYEDAVEEALKYTLENLIKEAEK